MKKIFLLLFCFFCSTVQAEDVSPWQKIYAGVREAYVGDVKIADLAVAALKGLKKIDKNLTVANDNKRISLYYKGRVVKVISKPESDNAGDWAKVTENMMAAAEEKSAQLQKQNFEVIAITAREMLPLLDDDSKFFESFDEAQNIKNHRQFAARKENDMLYVKMASINKQSKSELKKALSENNEAQSIILDLRGCVGGMFGEAIEIADLFLDEGIIAVTKEKIKDEETYYVAGNEEKADERELFVLVDGDTASAAEVLSAALKEQSRAKIIGTMTTGKGSMQKLINLDGQGVLAVTSGYFMSPSGVELNKKGVIPDICTFAQSGNPDVKVLSQKTVCPKESRENSEIELTIVKELRQNP